MTEHGVFDPTTYRRIQCRHKRIKLDSSVIAAPRRPMTAFVAFSQHRRESMQNQQHGMGHREITSMLGQEWRNMSEEERKM